MHPIPVEPSLEAFKDFSKQGNVVPVFTQLAADFETPLSAYIKLRDAKHSFLLESAEATDKGGRWSIVGSGPRRIFTARGKEITITDGNKSHTITAPDDVLAALEREMAPFKPVENPALPPFSGGMVGYLSYDAVSQFEPTLGSPPEDTLGVPDALFMLADTLLVFDHRLRRLQIIANAFLDEHDTPAEAHAAATGRIASILEILNRPLHVPALNGLAEVNVPPAASNTTQAEYEQMVRDGKEFIAAGDIFQFVPSQRFSVPFDQSPVDLYRALRHVNPSPYMFVLEMGDFALVGSSPEVHVRSVHGRIDIRPIAGTRWRGKTPEEDDALAAELLADPKERAEHLMLVDLARNDVGRIAKHGKVIVDDFMIIERYSHVMHIVSNVHGELDPAHTAYDVLRATFPAGTVSGAPKIRAMQIINSLEKNKRCAYAGAVGYFGFDGSHDSCITLRTCLLKDGMAHVQAGAGVVADSDPTYEYEETVNKSMALRRAIALAKTIKD
ncbi:MAG: anthranilate synthase component I [Akkermansiaceae bacterium]|nr:anthranilate synthase component I [Akkermansiaceae bacterium]MDP4646473.1 anthranilate synthase component I [Akkermansiaceae bacterium]MDP4780081.1 anthranilate synthase component I [Akkermansiaceae bacterium]MDP4847674.1 anthranilate synthase component I [Akkermansiaceae bacterium]MDP4896367.1 anthranilate synthase component I [Akkermansiaceae bacterium]